MWRRNIWERTAAALFTHKSADKFKKFCQKSKVNYFFLCQWSVLGVREHPHMYQHPQYYTAALHRSWDLGSRNTKHVLSKLLNSWIFWMCEVFPCSGVWWIHLVSQLPGGGPGASSKPTESISFCKSFKIVAFHCCLCLKKTSGDALMNQDQEDVC